MSHVYILWNPNHPLNDDMPIKIGYTDTPYERIINLETGSPTRYAASCWKVNESKTIEEFLHMAYDKYRIRGEWFAIPGSERGLMLRFISSISLNCSCKACDGFFDYVRAGIVTKEQVPNRYGVVANV